jgi:2,4-dienoyl-CoA reductase (NADPH2)
MTPRQIADVLSQPLKVGALTLRNRLVMGPMAATAPRQDGAPSDQTTAFFEARARGGVGMIIVGGLVATTRSYEEAPFRPLLRLDIDDHLPIFRRLADAVHAHGVPLIAEIMHGFGRMGVPGQGRPIIAASPKNVVIPKDRFPSGIIVPADRVTPVPDEATVAEIKAYESEMIEAADRARRSGWDGVEVAAHMSYFASSFLSSRTNWRTDEYGGSTWNRARILVEAVRGIRERVGRDFVVGLRITVNDYMPDGQGVAEFAAIAKLVEAEGLDYVALSTGCYETMDTSAPSVDGGMIDSGDARVFSDALSVPVLIQGLHDPANAAAAIAQGHGDAVMLARAFLADPEYARKAIAGRPVDIVRCDRDNRCMRRLVMNMPIRCSVNPAMGRESRAKGALPPLRRWYQAPIERAVLALTGSATLMKAIGAVANCNRRKTGEPRSGRFDAMQRR